MDSLVICPCKHTIVTHETGRCIAPGCPCMLGTAAVLERAIDLTKLDRRQTGAARVAAAKTAVSA